MGQLQEPSVTIIILLGTMAMLVLLGGIAMFMLLSQKRILRERQKRFEQEMNFQNRMIKAKLDSEEEERKRIASELHDSLGSLLWGAKVNLSFIQRSIQLKDQVYLSAKDLNEILDESIQVVRQVAWELTPEAFQYSGLSESVIKLCERLNGKDIEIAFSEENSMHWNDGSALQTFRIIQELISNAIKHSKATRIELKMSWVDNEFRAWVKDNGIGIENTTIKKGVGFWNINHRITLLKGEIHIGHPPIGTGVEISIKVPLTL